MASSAPWSPARGAATSPARRFKDAQWQQLHREQDLPVAPTQPGGWTVWQGSCRGRLVSQEGNQPPSVAQIPFPTPLRLVTPDGEGIRAEPPPALTWQSAHSHLASQRRITRWAVSITACHGRWRASPGPWFTTGAYLKPAEASRLSLRAYAPRFRR